MIRDRQPFPIWHERIFRTAQHCTHIVRMIIRRIEICIIADACRQLHHHIFLRVKNPGAKFCIIAQRCRFGREKMLNYFTRFTPRWPSESEKPIERILRENLWIHSASAPGTADRQDRFLKLWQTEMSLLFQNGKIENVLTDRDAHARRNLFWLKNSERQILDGKMRIASNVYKRFKRRHSLNKL